MRPGTMAISVGCLLYAAGVAAGANVGTIELFGYEYRVDRFDYSLEIQWEDPLFPPGSGVFAFMLEAEGFHSLGNDEFLISTDEGDAIFTLKNFIVKGRILRDGMGFPAGLEYVCTIIEGDEVLFPEWDLDSSGITINTGPDGLGANGGIIIADSEITDGLYLKAYQNTLNTCALANQLEWPIGSGCLGVNNGQFCGLDVEAETDHGDLQDVEYIPSLNEFWTIDKDDDRVVRFSTDGQFLGKINIGRRVDGALTGDVKGLAAFAPMTNVPGVLAGFSEVVLVVTDNDGPGIQAFTTGGDLISSTSLTDTGTATGNSLLDLGGCGFQLQLESIGVDNTTGEIILVNQGQFIDCNYLFVLTPLGPATPAETITITEIMYNPASSPNNTWEWVEIYNYGTEAINLAGFVLDDDDNDPLTSANITGGTIAAGSTAVLYNAEANDLLSIRSAWGSGINFVPVNNWQSLNNTSDRIGLWSSLGSYDNRNFANAIVDIEYDELGGVWPVAGGGASIYLIDENLDPSSPMNWDVSVAGFANAYTANPAGSNSGVSIGSPGLQSADDVTGACCLGTSPFCQIVTPNQCDLLGGSFSGPATVCNDCPLDPFFGITDILIIQGTGLPQFVNIQPIIAAGFADGIVVTEAMSRSETTEDWFELTNFGNSPVNISAWRFEDDSLDVQQSVPLQGITTIAPGESVVFIELAVKNTGSPAYNPAAEVAAFKNFWNLDPAVQVGYHAGPGLGQGDLVAIFNAAGVLQAILPYGNTDIQDPSGALPRLHAGIYGGGLRSHSLSLVPGTQLFTAAKPGVFGATIGLNGQDFGSPGAIDAPPVLTGACCLPEPALCEIVTESDCASLGGVYQGDLTNCSACPLDPFAGIGNIQYTNAGGNTVLASVPQIIDDGFEGGIVVTEAMSRSETTEDWFELTNFGSTAVDITGWTWDDDSLDVQQGSSLVGISSIAAGESVVFVELSVTNPASPAFDPAGEIAAFRAFWNLAPSVQVGYHSGPGLGTGDLVAIFDADGTMQAILPYGNTDIQDPSGVLPRLHAGVYGGGLRAHTLALIPETRLFTAAVDGEFDAVFGDNEEDIGSPGSIGITLVEPCPGDLNGDNQVNAADLGILLAAFGVSAGGDVNGDGITNAADLGILLAAFGNSCD